MSASCPGTLACTHSICCWQVPRLFEAVVAQTAAVHVGCSQWNGAGGDAGDGGGDGVGGEGGG